MAPDDSGNFDNAFSVDASHITFGAGCLAEAGDVARSLGMSRVGLFTDARVGATEHFATVADSLAAAGLDIAVYDAVRIEPTDGSFAAAAEFASAAAVDGFVSVGGGSVMDTTKAANLYSTYPAEVLRYVNAPVGDGAPVPGPLRPHLACPTTSGTGSESTGIAVLDIEAERAKAGVQSKLIRPDRALIDPNCTSTLPAAVVAATGFDVLNHALESYTARPYTRRPAATPPAARPSSQGANPWSDLGCVETLRLLDRYLVRGVADARDTEARHGLMWAATLAGIAFGNSGCHAPHAMSYAVSGLVRDYMAAGYPEDEPLVPHGMSVAVNAPAVFRRTAAANPPRHREAARLLGADVGGVDDAAAGEVLAGRIVELMQATAMPNGLHGVGSTAGDVAALVDRAELQRRLLVNAPIAIERSLLAAMFEDALTCW